MTDRLGLTYTAGLTIIIVYTPLPPGVSNKFMAIAENSVAGSLVRGSSGSRTLLHTASMLPFVRVRWVGGWVWAGRGVGVGVGWGVRGGGGMCVCVCVCVGGGGAWLCGGADGDGNWASAGV